MRARVVASLLTLLVTVGCLASFASSPSARAAQDVTPPTSTTPEVEVGGKVVERGPEKDPVDAADLARTGSGPVLGFVLIGLGLTGVGLVFVDVSRTPKQPGRRPLPRRRLPRRRRRREPPRVSSFSRRR